jgi:hydroxymethylpyrimidine pyrophosphatase-like HAD family hydrolase
MSKLLRRFDAVICDIDGCLGPESAAPFDTPLLLKVAEHNLLAAQRGDRPVLTVCSGRPQPFAEAMCRFLGNASVPCVAENGVWVYDPRDSRFLMDPLITREDREAVREATAWIERELLPRGVIIQPGKTASISLWHLDTAFLMGLMPSIRERFTTSGWNLRVSNTVAWINCDLAHVSKGSGIRRLIEICHFEKSRLAGIGDQMSDMAIRENVAHFACPSNADPALAARADFVSKEAEVRGVLDILGRL